MDSYFLTGIMIIISIVLGNFLFQLIMRFITPKAPIVPMGPKPVMANILSELDLLIDMECIGVIDIPMVVKTIPLIQDFSEVQKEIIHNVIESLSTSFWQECNRAGLKRAYIITYVTRRSHIKILEFMKDHNYSMK